MPVAKPFGVLAAVAAVVLAAGCGRVEPIPTRVHPSWAASPSGSASPSPDDSFEADPEPDPSDLPSALPAPTALPAATATACAGRPSTSQVVSALRRDRNLLPAGVTPTVV